MDKINANIIEILQANARISISELAKQVHLSAPAVAERARRLEEHNIISGYHARVDITELGYPIEAMVQVKVFAGKEPLFIAFAKQRSEIIECYNVTGEAAFICKIAILSMKTLDAFLEELSSIGESNTMMILSEISRKTLPAVISDN